MGKISNKSGESINYRPTKIKKIQYSREVKKNVPAKNEKLLKYFEIKHFQKKQFKARKVATSP